MVVYGFLWISYGVLCISYGFLWISYVGYVARQALRCCNHFPLLVFFSLFDGTCYLCFGLRTTKYIRRSSVPRLLLIIQVAGYSNLILYR
jgi:hypothetical protein